MKARIPADVEMADRIFFGLTFRQISILALDVLAIWGLFVLLRGRLQMWAIGVVWAPVVTVGLMLVASRPAGVSPERLLVFAFRYLLAPKRMVRPASKPHNDEDGQEFGEPSSEQGPGTRPALSGNGISGSVSVRSVLAGGAVDLGGEGIAVICRASCVNLALRSDSEKRLLTAGFARLLNSLDAPVEFLVHSEPADAEALIASLERRAPRLANPALSAAAFSYADFLRAVTSQRDVLTSTVYVCLRERRAGPDAARRLDRRAEELASLVRELGVAVVRLDAVETTALLHRTTNPSVIGEAAPDPGNFWKVGSQPPGPSGPPRRFSQGARS